MNDPSDLEQRLHRLLPAEVPAELQRRLRVAEPPTRTAWLPLPICGFFAAWCRPWPLAYAVLGSAWVAILLLHLLTQAPPLADRSVPVAQSSGDPATPAPATLTAGFSLDRAYLLTRSNNPDTLWP